MDPEPNREVDSPSARRRLAHWIRRGVALALLAAVVVAAYRYFAAADHAPSPRSATGSTGELPVRTIVVEPRDLPLTARYLAQIDASHSVELVARVTGEVVERAFEEGQAVEAGQVLFRIDPRPFEVALAQAEAQLAAAEARLQRAAQQLERFQELAEVQSAAATELEQWQEETGVAQAEVRLARARVEGARLDLEYTTIAAPIDGVIGRRGVDVGDFVQPAAGVVLATLRAVDPVYARFSISERDILRWQRLVALGEVTDVPTRDFRVTVVLADGREHPEIGTLDFVDVALDPTTGTALVRATVPNPARTLMPGQLVHVDVSGATRLGAVLVPQSSVVQSPGGASVYVVDEEGRAQVRQVTLGDWAGDAWVVERGLAAGERVVVDQLMRLRPGTPVVERKPDAEPAAAGR